MHAGLYRYKCLNYGTNSAAEICQYTLAQVLKGLKGVRNMADDIIIFAPTREAHNAALNACLRRLEEHHLKLNIKKCEFLKTSGIFRIDILSEGNTTRSAESISFRE